MPRFGAHMSIAGGLTNAIDLAVRYRCDCLQLFVKNQRQWRSRPLTERQVSDWLAARAATALARQDIPSAGAGGYPGGLAPVMVHDSYLINLASPDPAGWRRSYETFRDEADRCELLGIEYLVMHPGSHLGLGETEGLGKIIQSLDRLADQRPGMRTKVLLETTAGQGSNLGYRFEQLAEVLNGVARPDYFGVCLDTCHVFAAGYDLRTPAAVARTLDQFDSIIGLDKLLALHVNDSKRPRGILGSRIDRHEHIGRGCIGVKGFKAIVTEPRLADLPMILETPKGIDPASGRDWDAINLARLRRYAGLAEPTAAR